MTVIELPDDLAAALKAKADAQHLELEDWFRTLADAPPTGKTGSRLKLPALPLGDIGSLHRRDIYDDAL
jgi:hypothetical protein